MSENDASQIKHDVFVSLRGGDIRCGFLGHLTQAFKRNQIDAFIDDKNLKEGEEIWPSLVAAIEGSAILLIIFSPDYASSRWCLKELVKINDCRKKYKRTVIPVFYRIEPTLVRYQLGSYTDAFNKHERKHKTEVKLWRDAMNESANLSGFESSKFRNDAEVVEKIVNLVREKLTKTLFNSKRLVGIDEKIAIVESLIRKEPHNTRLIGIWGMCGIGKTTLAEEVFKKLQCEFEGSYFLANERDQSKRHGMIPLKEMIFSKLLGYDVKIDTPNLLPDDIVRRIGRRKILIVLDDVNDSEHIENLLGTLDIFGSGSRIIVTTRNKQVLKANKANEEYQLKILSFDEALELFNLNVFNQSDLQREYNELSHRVVNYAQGIPLVLKVLASHLRGNGKEVWESKLDKLKKMPLKEVYDVMKWSYNDLDRKERQIFLDLACFFLRSHKEVNVDNLKSLLKDDENDNSVVVDLKKLEDRALITFSKDNSLQEMTRKIVRREPDKNNVVFMHDGLQEMAWEIVREPCELGSHSRLWDSDDIFEALKTDKGIKAIRSMQIKLSTIKQELSPHIFAKMNRLQFLEISGKFKDRQHYILAEGLRFLANELRFLGWQNYPLKSLPENFSVEKLVILSLPHNNLVKLWDGVKNMVNLEEVDLSGSKKLKELPDLSRATNLKVLYLSGCYMLAYVHPSIFSLVKLKILDLCNCESLTTLASNFHICNLSYLNLSYCKNLTEFSMISKNMVQLSLEDCESLEILPKLPLSLETLYAQSCSSLLALPKLPKSLKTLEVTDCKSLQTLPKLPPSLKNLSVEYCSSLQTLPKLPTSLETLNTHHCDSLETLPELFLPLDTLNVEFCPSLKTLPKFPQSLKTLVVTDCKSLQILPELPMSLENIYAQSCSSLLTLPKLFESLKVLLVTSCESLQTLPELPLSLETLDAKYCSSLQTLPQLPLSLKTKTLDVTGCESLQTLTELPPSLKTLKAHSCISLQTLPELPLSLETLDVENCTSLETLPELPPFLKTLNAKNCRSLETVLLFPSTTVEQLKENRKRVVFWNCLKLDEHSLVAIELNVQINVMKFANFYLSTPNHDHVENYNDYDYGYNHQSYEAIYVYPVSSVPNWLQYKTTTGYIIIDLSSTPPCPQLGFIFCFVLPENQLTKMFERPEVKLIVSDEDGEGKKSSVKIYIDKFGWQIESDHVYVMYDQRCSAFLHTRAKNQTRFKIQVAMGTQVLLEEFGVSTINTSTYNSFIQEMELRDSMFQFH
uniref:TMV resistance protein N n=1 Tax=Cajanus cajan TaxID=3821 RepID=A0A151QP15_CAJCA|nr:TMV resistance protein N [Cajanus cajan]